jgi:hypothetical protein
MRSRIFLFLFTLMAAATAGAHPVPFKGALSVMTWNQPFFNETMTTYSFARQAAVAGQYMRMDMSDGEMKAYVPQLNLLAKRWNELDSQANVYLVGGWGGYEFNDRKKTTALAGAEIDWESRKYYVSAKGVGLFPSFDDNTYVQTYRAGISAYPAEFDEMSTWLILDLQHINRRTREFTLTPVMRFFYRNMLAEIGASFSGDYMLNFMVHL